MTEPKTKKFFWLHIKKSGGQSTRAALAPYYKTVDRKAYRKCFIQAEKSEYNDILNNYRTPLGTYQFRRALFAKKFLYGDDWNHMVKFAFSREPVRRAVSAFYQFLGGDTKEAYKNRLRFLMHHHRPVLGTSYAFDCFLQMIIDSRGSDTAAGPYGLHFATHTATMWNDVTDGKGVILLDYIFRLENFRMGINRILKECNIPQADDSDFVYRNQRNHPDYQPTRRQLRKIETLYSRDFEIYERKTYTKKV